MPSCGRQAGDIHADGDSGNPLGDARDRGACRGDQDRRAQDHHFGPGLYRAGQGLLRRRGASVRARGLRIRRSPWRSPPRRAISISAIPASPAGSTGSRAKACCASSAAAGPRCRAIPTSPSSSRTRPTRPASNPSRISPAIPSACRSSARRRITRWASSPQKYGFDLKTLRLVPLQTLPNMASAVSSGQIDATVVTGSLGAAVLARGDAQLLGYVGDEAPFQLGAVMTVAQDGGRARRHHPALPARGRQGVAGLSRCLHPRRQARRWSDRARDDRHHRQERGPARERRRAQPALCRWPRRGSTSPT